MLAGRTVADLSRSVFSLAVMVGLGLLVGFGFNSSVPRILAGMAVILAFGYAFSWMYAAIGLATKDPETAQIAGILPFFVLIFASNAIVPRRHDARLAAGLRAQSAAQHHGRGCPGAVRGRRGRALGLAVARVGRGHLRRLLHDLDLAVPERDRLSYRSTSWSAMMPE